MERTIIPALLFVGVTGVAVVLTFTLMCIPFHKLWQVYPDPKGTLPNFQTIVWIHRALVTHAM